MKGGGGNSDYLNREKIYFNIEDAQQQIVAYAYFAEKPK